MNSLGGTVTFLIFPIIVTFSLFAVIQLTSPVLETYGLSWKTETVEEYGVGKFTSIAVDSLGRPHISYYDLGNGYLKYAFRSGNSWTIENVTKAGPPNDASVSVYTAIAVDSSGRPHISYYDDNENLLKYAERSANGSWDVTTVDTGKYSGMFPSIALDSSNNPHISYHGVATGIANGYLKYAIRSGNGSWLVEVVDSNNDSGYDSSITLDHLGNPQISYTSYPNIFNHVQASLKFASKSNGAWTTEPVNVTEQVQGYTSLALDSKRNPHIAYYQYGNNNDFLKFASKSNGAWTTEVVDNSGNSWRFASVTISQANNTYISYFDIQNGDLKFASKSNGAWTTEVVDSSGDVGRFSSIAMDSTGNIHISYYKSYPLPLSLKHATARESKPIPFDQNRIVLGAIGPPELKLKLTVEMKCTEAVGRVCIHNEVTKICVGSQCFKVPNPRTPPSCPACRFNPN